MSWGTKNLPSMYKLMSKETTQKGITRNERLNLQLHYLYISTLIAFFQDNFLLQVWNGAELMMNIAPAWIVLVLLNGNEESYTNTKSLKEDEHEQE